MKLRAKEISNIIEGFKLDSLRTCVESNTPVQIKVLKEGFTDKEKMSPFIFWEESDGMKYVIHLDHHLDSSRTKDRATLYFYGGESIEYRPKLTKLNSPFLFEDFMAFASGSLLYKAGLERFESYRSLVKTHGVDGFVKVMPKVTPADRTYRNFKDWLKEKTK
jgi:hypothetical protein